MPLFILSSKPGNSITSKSPSINTIAEKPMNVIKQAGQAAIGEYISNPQFRANVNDKTGKVYNQARNIVNNNRNNSNGNNPNGGGRMNYSHSSGYALTKAPNPKPTQLDSGVIPNTYVSDYMNAIENQCVPLHLSHNWFQFPNYSGSALYSYFLNITAFDIQTKAQANVGFNVPVSGSNPTFTAAQILTAFNSLANALQVYFYYSSIISYSSVPGNQNSGMNYLRQQIDPATLEYLSQLGKRLMDTPCPPKMLEMIRYLMSNYMSGATTNSSILKICPFAANPNGVQLSAVAGAVSDLASDANNAVFTLLRRTVPQWKINTLYDPDPIPNFDPNFNTIIANLPFVYWNGSTNLIGPAIVAETDAIIYNSYTNVLDGAAYALAGGYSSTVTNYLPGLIRALGTADAAMKGESRSSYYAVSGVSKFYNTALYPFIKKSRQETYQSSDDGTILYTPHLYGTSRCQNVTANSIRETSMKVIDWMMDSESIKNPDVKATLTGRPAKSGDRRRPSRSGNK